MRCEKCGATYSAIIHITRVPFVGWLCIACAEDQREKGETRCSGTSATSAASGPSTKTTHFSA